MREQMLKTGKKEGKSGSHRAICLSPTAKGEQRSADRETYQDGNPRAAIIADGRIGDPFRR